MDAAIEHIEKLYALYKSDNIRGEELVELVELLREHGGLTRTDEAEFMRNHPNVHSWRNFAAFIQKNLGNRRNNDQVSLDIFLSRFHFRAIYRLQAAMYQTTRNA
jgi:hypothetical protein